MKLALATSAQEQNMFESCISTYSQGSGLICGLVINSPSFPTAKRLQTNNRIAAIAFEYCQNDRIVQVFVSALYIISGRLCVLACSAYEPAHTSL